MSNVTFNKMDKNIYDAILKAYNETFPDDDINNFHIQFQGNDDGTCVAILVIDYNKSNLKDGKNINEIEEVWLDKYSRVLYVTNNNSISFIVNNVIKLQIDEFYRKVKDVLNAEFRNFEVGFNSFIESVGGII